MFDGSERQKIDKENPDSKENKVNKIIET